MEGDEFGAYGVIVPQEVLCRYALGAELRQEVLAKFGLRLEDFLSFKSWLLK